MDLRVRIVRSLDAPGLRSAWLRLTARTSWAGLFSTYEWCWSWAQSIGRGCELCLMQFEDSAGEMVGLLPGCIERRRGTRWLKFLGRDRACGDHLDLLCAPEHHPACLGALTGFVDEWSGCHGLLLGELDTRSPTLARLRRWAAVRRLPHLEREQRVVPFVDLPSDFESYLASLSANMRYHLRRRRREAERDGAGVVLIKDVDQVDGLLDDLFVLHQRRWERDGERGVFWHPDKQAFLRHFCREASAQGWLRAYAVDRDGRREAVLLAFHWRDTASFYQMGWDPDSRLSSPGVVLLAESIAQAIREGLRRYDFLRGDEAYKRKWTGESVSQTTLIVARALPARVALAGERLKKTCKAAIRRTLGQRGWDAVKHAVDGARR